MGFRRAVGSRTCSCPAFFVDILGMLLRTFLNRHRLWASSTSARSSRRSSRFPGALLQGPRLPQTAPLLSGFGRTNKRSSPLPKKFRLYRTSSTTSNDGESCSRSRIFLSDGSSCCKLIMFCKLIAAIVVGRQIDGEREIVAIRDNLSRPP